MAIAVAFSVNKPTYIVFLSRAFARIILLRHALTVTSQRHSNERLCATDFTKRANI